jgi:hypothetical protein
VNLAADPHPLEVAYQLSAAELLDALSKRFRARVALEGAVAEVHLGKHIEALCRAGTIKSFEEHDLDGDPDLTIQTMDGRTLTIECKNVRDADEAYRVGGQVVAYKVETQKTRASRGDPASRFYDVGYFDVLAVCLGKKTGDWRQFAFARAAALALHAENPAKLAVMQRVPLVAPDGSVEPPWHASLTALLSSMGAG